MRDLTSQTLESSFLLGGDVRRKEFKERHGERKGKEMVTGLRIYFVLLVACFFDRERERGCSPTFQVVVH